MKLYGPEENRFSNFEMDYRKIVSNESDWPESVLVSKTGLSYRHNLMTQMIKLNGLLVSEKNSVGQKWPNHDVPVKPFLDRITDFINLFYDFLCAEFNNFHIFVSIIFPNLKLLWQSFHFILAISHFCDQIKDFNLGFCLKINVQGSTDRPWVLKTRKLPW